MKSSNHIWQRDDISSYVPTLAVYQGRVYLFRVRGEIECIAPASGKTIWSDPFPKDRASFYASLLIAGGKLYAPHRMGLYSWLP